MKKTRVAAASFAHLEAVAKRQNLEIRNPPIARIAAHFIQRLVCLRHI